MQYDYIEEFKHFADVVKSLREDDKKYREEIEELNGLKKDIRHIYEFGGVDAIDMMQLASVFRNNLKKRREKLNNHKIIKRLLNKVDKINTTLDRSLLYTANAIEKEVNQDRNYYARSELGQALINKYSVEGDDLVSTATQDQLEELANKF